MRKIKSPEEIAQSKKKLKLLVGGVLIFLMVFSTAGFAFFSGGGLGGGTGSPNNIQENTGDFNGRHWVYQKDGQEFYFTNPLEITNNVPININFNLNNYLGTSVYIVSDNDLIISEITQNLARYTGRLQKACYGKCEEDLPEKTCNDNLIIWQEAEENRVYQDQNCIFIESAEADLRAVDAFLYKILEFS